MMSIREQEINELYNRWVSGKRKHVIGEIIMLPTIDGIYLAVKVFEQMSLSDKKAFVVMLENRLV